MAVTETRSAKPTVRDLLWMSAGALPLIALGVVIALYSRGDSETAARLALKAKRAELVDRMRLGIAAASEAEKSAVLAATEDESRRYVDQARSETAKVEQAGSDLRNLLEQGGTADERKSFEQFSSAFSEFRRIDGELLDLATKNTNVKAYGMAFGPAAVAIGAMDASLSQLLSKATASGHEIQVTRLALGAEANALRIQALLAPHIAEEDDAKMDALEARMNEQDREVRKDLDALAALPNLGGDSDVQAAVSSYARFTDLRKQILALSRENTNVRSLAISLKQKRNAMLLCQDALATLNQAVLDEHVPGVDYGRFGSPIKVR
jgi:Four helix bundle sensory module for signal transduction